MTEILRTHPRACQDVLVLADGATSGYGSNCEWARTEQVLLPGEEAKIDISIRKFYDKQATPEVETWEIDLVLDCRGELPMKYSAEVVHTIVYGDQTVATTKIAREGNGNECWPIFAPTLAELEDQIEAILEKLDNEPVVF